MCKVIKDALGSLLPLILLLMHAHQTQGAILSGTSQPSVVDGGQLLAIPAEFGLPDAFGFWNLNSLYWDQAGEVTIQASIDSAGIPITGFQAVFFTVGNIEAGEWTRIEIDLVGNAVFSQIAPIESSPISATPVISEDQKSLVLSGMDWPEGSPIGIGVGPTTSNLSFSLTLAPAEPDESVLLIFRPIPVPEPGSGLLLLAGCLALSRRQQSRR